MNKLTSARPIYLAILLILVALLSVGPALAAPSQQGDGPTDPAELEAFLDGLMAEHMEELHIAGAAVAVVKDGELFFAKGYGYADLETGTPVDPNQTLFGIGSASKIFVWGQSFAGRRRCRRCQVRDAQGGSEATVSGSGQNVTVAAEGGSTIDLTKFSAVDANTNARGASQVTVDVSGRLDVDASNGANVYYLGDPTLGTIDTSGSATVEPK